jgi:hypothetical protein
MVPWPADEIQFNPGNKFAEMGVPLISVPNMNSQYMVSGLALAEVQNPTSVNLINWRTNKK